MPRGRKGPPQENIDSILLAMSRRTDIDSDTLSHYFDRLDEEWTDGARDKVLHLLRTNDVTAHSAAVLILSELATDFDLEELEDFVADPTVGDLAKLTLAPVLNELDSEMADEGIIDYLNDPEAALLQMQMRLLDLMGQSEIGVESVLEDVLTMPMDRRLGFINWLGGSQDPRASKLLLPLLENQSSKVVTATIDALEQLGAVAAYQSIPALNFLLTNSSNRQLKQHARAALGRLTMYLTPGQEEAAMEQTLQKQETLYEARVSFIDGSGTQMVMLAWRRSDGLLKSVNVLSQDTWGIKDCYGTDEMEVESWTELVESMEEQGFGSYQVSLDYCRALIADARAMNKRTRHKLPVAYAIWRPSIEGNESSNKNASTAKIMLEPCVFTPDLSQLAKHGDELLDLQEFESWTFEPFESIRPYVNSYIEASGAVDSSRVRKRRGGLKANQETIVSDVLEKVVDDKWRLLYESRMRRQGALFQYVGRKDDALLVSAVTAALHPDSGLAPHEQPFLRAFMHRSLSNGLLRIMAEALEGGPFGSFPSGLFHGKDDFYF
ncbi:MAG TPA: HEAT repeat domain-containing protein [Ktedonobacteraceae bacterium]